MVSRRQPEGIIKDECRDEHARPNDLIFWQIEGKSTNGVPDTLAGKVTGGAILIEFKVKGRKPNDQQFLRIFELRAAGVEAWWADDIETYRKLVRLDEGGYKVEYPERAKRIIRKMYGADSV